MLGSDLDLDWESIWCFDIAVTVSDILLNSLGMEERPMVSLSRGQQENSEMTDFSRVTFQPQKLPRSKVKKQNM